MKLLFLRKIYCGRIEDVHWRVVASIDYIQLSLLSPLFWGTETYSRYLKYAG